MVSVDGFDDAEVIDQECVASRLRTEAMRC